MTAGDRLRRPTVAGYCYPSDPETLRRDVARLVVSDSVRVPAKVVIVPHGSYVLSGGIAGETFSRIAVPRRCVVLGPNHTGEGAAWSLMARGAYQTPLGTVPVDEAFAEALMAACPLIQDDHRAHQVEHAIEVQLPFLQCVGPEDLRIVPMVISGHREDELRLVSRAIAEAMRASPEPTLLIASANLTHYEPREIVAAKDAQLLEAIAAVDPAAFARRLEALRPVMCSERVIGCALLAAQQLAVADVSLIRYATSADAGGDPDSAIGYAGLLMN